MALVVLKKECYFILNVEFSILVMFLIISHYVLVATFIKKPSLPLAAILSGGPPSFSQISQTEKGKLFVFHFEGGAIIILTEISDIHCRVFALLSLAYLLARRFVALCFHRRGLTFNISWTT